MAEISELNLPLIDSTTGLPVIDESTGQQVVLNCKLKAQITDTEWATISTILT